MAMGSGPSRGGVVTLAATCLLASGCSKELGGQLGQIAGNIGGSCLSRTGIPGIESISDVTSNMACTTSGLCDCETATRFFGKYAYDFHGLLAPHIEAQRAELRDKEIGSGVEFFSREYRHKGVSCSAVGPSWWGLGR